MIFISFLCLNIKKNKKSVKFKIVEHKRFPQQLFVNHSVLTLIPNALQNAMAKTKNTPTETWHNNEPNMNARDESFTDNLFI